ncbi:MAG: TMEM165/GDT1 family protein [Acidimicrobiaceae bacterium]|nr:TMEM165/GDT1 family protein [Acidimicrobiaceae bacterium]
MNLRVLFTVFPLVFLGELPDKTMFASLVLASRGRPIPVWMGAAGAFVVHVVIAVSIGEALFAILPHSAVEVFVAALFAAGAVYSWLARNAKDEEADIAAAPSAWRMGLAAFGVIFVAEWGDLTQIITANLAARYHDALSVGVGALAALWLVAAIAVAAGSNLLKIVSVRTLRIVTAVVLLGLSAYSFVNAFTG